LEDINSEDINKFIKNKEDGKLYQIDSGEPVLSLEPITQLDVEVDTIKFNHNVDLANVYLEDFIGFNCWILLAIFYSEDFSMGCVIEALIDDAKVEKIMVYSPDGSFTIYQEGAWLESEVSLPETFILREASYLGHPDFEDIYYSIMLETTVPSIVPKLIPTTDDIDTAISQAITGVLEGEV